MGVVAVVAVGVPVVKPVRAGDEKMEAWGRKICRSVAAFCFAPRGAQYLFKNVCCGKLLCYCAQRSKSGPVA